MDPILTIDIGAGTTDILVYFPDKGEHYKAVAVSPIRKMAETIQHQKGDLLITGTIMGGGAVSNALVRHAQSYLVYMTPEAARTINDNLGKVRKQGITIVAREEAQRLQKDKKINQFTFGDLSPSGIRILLKELGVEWNFSYVAGAVQDHGVGPEGVTALDFRHQFIKARMEGNPFPEQFLFSAHEIPEYLTRMKATANLLGRIPHDKVFMMDTGMAAIMGASLDSRLQECTHFIVADIGNSHTLGALLRKGEIGGFFEYHTNSITSQRLEELLINLGNGSLNHQAIIAQGGHGAYIRFSPGFDKIERIVVTGPRRRELMNGVTLQHIDGAPLGDNMMTGTAGLLESVKRREKLNLPTEY